MNIVILGLSITSSWGNGHATTYRGLVRELGRRGHHVLFIERDAPWYAQNRDLSETSLCRVALYRSMEELFRFAEEIESADCVIVGSYAANGVEVSEWVMQTARGLKAFYDIDTPITLSKLARGDYEYLNLSLIPRFDLYLSFTGGPILEKLEREYHSPKAVAFYCSVNPAAYYNESLKVQWDLGYLGTYSEDRQPALDRLLIQTAAAMPDQQFVVAGPQYPSSIAWPANVERIEHAGPDKHCHFYNSQRFTLNITRQDMIKAGWSPSVRLFEAAACGIPIISDRWDGIETFFKSGAEILLVDSSREVRELLCDMPEQDRLRIGLAARARILSEHTAAHRAAQLESLIYNHQPASRRWTPMLASTPNNPGAQIQGLKDHSTAFTL